MSIEMWPDPNNPGKEYPIGTIGWETEKNSLSGLFVDFFRDTFPQQVSGMSIYTLAAGLIMNPSGAVPT